MGELSKRIGEFGENTAESILEEFGWNGAQKAIVLPNMFPDRKKKQTYGIDYLFSYECPMRDDTVKNVIISVKYHKDNYPEGYRTLAKSHLTELSEISESFNFSEVKSIANDNLNGLMVEDIGLLIWLCHNPVDLDLRRELANIKLELPYPNSKIILLDNKQIDYLLSSILFFKINFNSARFEFYYHNTGQNINPVTRNTSGKRLPIEYVFSSVLPFKIVDGKNTILGLTTSDPFNKSNLRRLMGLAQELSTNLSSSVLFAFNDYDPLEHQNEFEAVKSEFIQQDFADKISITNYNNHRFKIS
jgi:hypothetical protein